MARTPETTSFGIAAVEFKPLNECDARPVGRPDDAPARHVVRTAQGLARATLPGQAATCAKLHGFDLRDGPLLTGLAGCHGELVTARSAVPLRRDMIGATVLVLFEDGDPARPIIVGVLQEGLAPLPDPASPMVPLSCDVDGQRLTLSAEREIVLRCGEASITLTRGGKVVIQGSYVLSRSTGYNKIKGAAIDIN